MHAESPARRSPALQPRGPRTPEAAAEGPLCGVGSSHTAGLGRAIDCHMKSKEFSVLPCNLVLRFQCFFYWDTSLGFRFLSVQSLSHVQLFVTPWTAACQASLSITNSWSLLMSIKLVMPSNHLILCCPLLLLPSVFPSIDGSVPGSSAAA